MRVLCVEGGGGVGARVRARRIDKRSWCMRALFSTSRCPIYCNKCLKNDNENLVY